MRVLHSHHSVHYCAPVRCLLLSSGDSRIASSNGINLDKCSNVRGSRMRFNSGVTRSKFGFVRSSLQFLYSFACLAITRLIMSAKNVVGTPFLFCP